jgi:hypothetical protein
MILVNGQLNDRLGLGMSFAVFRLFSQGFHVDAVGSLVLSNERGFQSADFLPLRTDILDRSYPLHHLARDIISTNESTSLIVNGVDDTL